MQQRRINFRQANFDWKDATFPAFEATKKTPVVTIEFDELPEILSGRKSHLSDMVTALHKCC
jgi:hypothetical protein